MLFDREKILRAEPCLQYGGLGRCPADRDFMSPEFILQVEHCMIWIQKQNWGRKISSVYSSYGYKHIVERSCGRYISNGAFIAAVILLDLPYKRDSDSPNILIPLLKIKKPRERALN